MDEIIKSLYLRLDATTSTLTRSAIGQILVKIIYTFDRQVSKEEIFGITYDEMETSPEGIIALMPDFDNFEIKTVLTDSDSKCTAYVPILENVPEREYYGRSATQIKEMIPVQYDTEQGVMAFIYGKDGIRGFSIDDVTNEEYILDNDYVYYFSVEFSKF